MKNIFEILIWTSEGKEWETNRKLGYFPLVFSSHKRKYCESWGPINFDLSIQSIKIGLVLL